MSSPPVLPEVRQELATLLATLDEQLLKVGASYAEQAFGLGCAVSAVPLGILLLLLYILGVRSWIPLLLVGLAGALVATGLAAWAAQRARHNATQRLYENQAAGEIAQFIEQHQLSAAQFEQLATETLPGSPSLLRWSAAQGEKHVSRQTQDHA